ncbi:MAG: hypothetical protein E7247_25275 [Paenibacillaceae bacterium]|nr:hypothetical protein [Paenibacillaceae bacterium]
MKEIIRNKEKYLKTMLENAEFHYFTFHTNFLLGFICKQREIAGIQFPTEITLSILGDWWFGDENEWKSMVTKMTKESEFVEPDEPVKAFKLAALRWTEGAEIDSIELLQDRMKLHFRSGEIITIMNFCDDEECAWEICNTYKRNNDDVFSIYCDGGIIYCNIQGIEY